MIATMQRLIPVLTVLFLASACGAMKTTNTPPPTATPPPTEEPLEKTGAIDIQEPWISARIDPGSARATRARMPRVGEGEYPAFMRIVNNSDTDDRLIDATANVSGTVTFYASEPVEEQQQQVAEMTIPANDRLLVEPGPGYHILLEGLEDELRAGDKVNMTLSFEQAGDVEIEVPVSLPRQQREQIR